MAQPLIADHLLAAALAALSLALASGRLAQGTAGDRDRFYRSATASSLALPFAVLGLWAATGRDLADFGLRDWLGDGRTTLLLGAACVALLAAYVAAVRRGFMRAQLTPIYSRLGAIMPTNARELRASWLTSLVAGSGEEIVYRGFLLWYAASLIGVPAALIVTSLLFGAAHGYQSRWGMVFATLAGLVLAALYLASDSLALAMWAHATYNMASFYIGMVILRGRQAAP